MPGVDAHQHFWDTSRVPLPWLRPEHEPIRGPFAPKDLDPLRHQAGVEQTIVVQAACLDADTDFMFELAERHEWIAAVVAWLPLLSPEQTARRLVELTAEPKLRGIRHLIHDEDDPHWILRPEVLESLRLVEAHGLILELPAVFPRHLGDVPVLAREFPRMTLVIDHLGKPPLDGDLGEWAVTLRNAARCENVVAKISGLNTATARRDWDAGSLRPALEVALECFGAQRLLWGSDWPVSLLNGDYARVWDEPRRAVESLAPEVVEDVFGGNARRLYRLSD